MDNLYWILPLAVALVVIGLALWVVFTWLSSRGKFMFLHCVALDKAEVSVPWHKFARQGNSLFLFRLVLGLIGMVPDAAVGGGCGRDGHRMINRGEPDIRSILVLVGVVLVLIAVGLVFAVIAKLTTDFVVPIMFLRGANVWGLAGIARPHLGQRRQLRAVSAVPSGAGIGDRRAHIGRRHRDLLHRRLFDGHSVSGHGVVAARFGVQQVLFALLPGAVWHGI